VAQLELALPATPSPATPFACDTSCLAGLQFSQ
jgi:hypothetical protein